MGKTQFLSIKVFYYQLMHKRIVFQRVLKFTLKLQQLQHVSVRSPSPGSVLCELAKFTVLQHLVKIHHCGQSGGVAAYVIRSAMKNITSSTAIIRNFENKFRIIPNSTAEIHQ